MYVEDKNTILLATRNPGKIREFSVMLKSFGLHTLDLDSFPDLPPAEETGGSFLENAMLKAVHGCSGSGLIAVADDSGLVVDALDGRPGIYSARFSLTEADAAGKEPSAQDGGLDARNNARLIALMDGMEGEQRRGSYVCVLAATAPNGARVSAEGRWDGYILEFPKGQNGFGYDPLFFDPELGRSAAEMSLDEKNARSHRAKALRRLLELWPDFQARAFSLS